MNSSLIREKFLKFFESRGHRVVPSSSLIPDDPSVLLTTAGMQQFKKYYTKELNAKADFGMLNTASVQKCFRTSDIDEVGDERHLTFFEMLGNFSFGGYFKEEAIKFAYDFVVKEMGLAIDYVTVFEGNDAVPRDEESIKIWKSLDKDINVKTFGMDDNFWGPTGTNGPCGPTTEIYVKNGAGESVEIWNVVFNEFFCTGSREELIAGKAELKKSETPGIDTGMGLERLAMVAQKTKNVFETDLFSPIINLLPEVMPDRVKRIVADHMRALTFLLSDGVLPSNKGAGYILRRLMRRAIVHEYLANNRYELDFDKILELISHTYGKFYPELRSENVIKEFKNESDKFKNTLTSGLKELKRIEILNAESAFKLYESYGLPYEIIKDPEITGDKAKNLHRNDFEEEFKKHQEKSRAGAEKKFGGHGLILDTGELKAGDKEELERATRLHTTTHLLQQALRDVLGDSVHQMGSDVTAERTRFDFAFSRKLTKDEIKKVEDIINEKIKEDLVMQSKELPKDEAIKTGALHFFKEKYPDLVKVYYLGKDGGEIKDAYSKEFCGGPHVNRTSEIGKVKILKEEAVSAGVRRIRAVLA